MVEMRILMVLLLSSLLGADTGDLEDGEVEYEGELDTDFSNRKENIWSEESVEVGDTTRESSAESSNTEKPTELNEAEIPTEFSGARTVGEGGNSLLSVSEFACQVTASVATSTETLCGAGVSTGPGWSSCLSASSLRRSSSVAALSSTGGGSSQPLTASVLYTRPGASVSGAFHFSPLQFADCSRTERGFNKIFSREARPDQVARPERLQDRINVTFGSTIETRDYAQSRNLQVETVMVHPDYWEDETKTGSSYDLALIKMNKVSGERVDRLGF